jgi:hypothetical protein
MFQQKPPQEETTQPKHQVNFEEMLWGGSFSYIDNNVYVFNINNNLNVIIQVADIHIAHIYFTDGNNAIIPAPPGFVLQDLTANQVLVPFFGFLYSITWQCDYIMYGRNNQVVFALNNNANRQY